MDGENEDATIKLPIVDPIDQMHASDCFYSNYVIELVTKVFTAQQYDPVQYEDAIYSDLTFNLDRLDFVLNHLLTEKDVSYDVETIEEMNQYLEQIVPVIDCVYGRFEEVVRIDKTGQKLISIIEPNLFWTGNWKPYFIDSIEIALCWQKNLFINSKLTLEEEQTTRSILALYIITSGLEQALGNLILTQSHFVPPLLKTLLTMPELENLIGIRLIRLLKVIVGPPITINLRNILWHGFVNCSNQITNPLTDCLIEIDLLKFFYFLLSISVSIGIELQKQNVFQKLKIELTNTELSAIKLQVVDIIPQRKLFNFDEFAFKLEGIFPFVDLGVVNFDYFKDLINDCPLIHKTFRPLWLAAFSLYFNETENHYQSYSFCLLMPLLESSLRYLYCSLNHLSNRLLTAICREYYVTFTEILAFNSMLDDDEEEVKECSHANYLYNLLPRRLMFLLLDIILLPEGLRFRDRLSHGQIELHNINSTVSNYVISSIIAVLQLANLRTNPLCLNSTQPEIIQLLLSKCSTQYECLYHPVYQLKSQLKSLVGWFLQLIEQVKLQIDLATYDQWRIYLKGHLDKITSLYNLDEPFISNCDALVLLLRNCLKNYELFVQNLYSFHLIRGEELSKSKLRSRQRANYQTMLQCVPFFLKTFCAEESLFWSSFLTMFFSLDHMTNLWCSTLEQKNSLEKLLKRLLKTSENFAQQSSIKENQWDNVTKLCLEQSGHLKQVFQFIEL